MILQVSHFKSMFEHDIFEKYESDQIPLNRGCQLMDVADMEAYEQFELQFTETAEGQPDVIDVTVTDLKENTIELSWLVNMRDRFHSVDITLPLDQFFGCVECLRDNDPVLFVGSKWLKNIFDRHYSIFCWIDVQDTEKAIEDGVLTEEKLRVLRSGINQLARKYPDVFFLSFADNILLKASWTLVNIDLHGEYTYAPERILFLVDEIKQVFSREKLGIYAILTQGFNLYDESSLAHCEAENHVCLNTLGLPFAEIFDIEKAVKTAVKKEVHPRCDLYMDASVYRSLNRQYGKETPCASYARTKLSNTDSNYYYCALNTMLSMLEKRPPHDP
jgi:hypothetical protein